MEVTQGPTNPHVPPSLGATSTCSNDAKPADKKRLRYGHSRYAFLLYFLDDGRTLARTAVQYTVLRPVIEGRRDSRHAPPDRVPPTPGCPGWRGDLPEQATQHMNCACATCAASGVKPHGTLTTHCAGLEVVTRRSKVPKSRGRADALTRFWRMSSASAESGNLASRVA